VKITRRRGLLVAVGVAVAAGVGAVAIRPSPPQPCRATFEKVRAGMTTAEIEATVGGPPGDYSQGQNQRRHFPPVPMLNENTWLGPDAELAVYYSDDRAFDIRIDGMPIPKPLSVRVWFRARLRF
jgi:hypothetical protein